MMSNQDDTYSWPLGVQELTWAMRHGKKIDGLENIMLSNQPTVIAEKKMENNKETTSLHNDILEQQIEKLEKIMTREIASLKNEFAMVVETQLNSFFPAIKEQLQENERALREEVSKLTSQLTELQQLQCSNEKEIDTDWYKKVEEKQTKLAEDMDYIQYIMEDIATRPPSIEAQQKLRESFFIREITAVKREIAFLCQAWKSQGIYLGSDDQIKVYKRRQKRR